MATAKEQRRCFRVSGNEALGRDDYSQAAKLYTEGLIELGVESAGHDTVSSDAGALEPATREEAGKLLSNRSLAWYRLEEWELALRDAERVIKLAPSWEKGYIRKALVLVKIKAPLVDIVDVYQAGVSRAPGSSTLKHALEGAKESLLKLIENDKAGTSSGTSVSKSDSSSWRPEQQPNAAIRSAVLNDKDEGSGTGRITWNEESLAKHEAERGVLYARMTIDQPDTPFLVYDEKLAREENKIGTVENRHATPEFVDIGDLQRKLGLLEADQDSGFDIVGDKSKTPFEIKRAEIYKDEGTVFKASSSSSNTNDKKQ